MRFRKTAIASALAIAVMGVLAALPSLANAAAYYEFTTTGSFFGSAEFIYEAPALLTSDTAVMPQSCFVSGGQSCAGASFDLSPNAFGGTDDEISFSYNNAPLASAGGGTGFYFFQQGALSNYGSYTDAGYPVNTPGYGNAGFATLDVTDTAPAPLVPFASAAPEPSSWLLMIAGIGGIGLMMRRARKSMGFRFVDALSA